MNRGAYNMNMTNKIELARLRWLRPMLLLALLAGLAGMPAARAQATVEGLRCEYRENPLAIDVARPRLSWIIASGRRGEIQGAYQVLVASSPERLARDQGDCWDSGKVESHQSAQVEYGGKPLSAGDRCFWKVRAWDRDGQVSPWSETACWGMGPMREADWKGTAWIGWQPDGPADPKSFRSVSPWLRKTFTLEAQPKRAVAYVNLAGYGELYVNGRKVGADMLTPAVSDYWKRSFYVAYDIAPYLKPGRNCVGLWLGRGWFKGAVKPAGARVRMQCDLIGGAKPIRLATDATWKAAPSPYTTFGSWSWNDFGGEQYDARLENPEWSSPSFDDGGWADVQVCSPPSPVAQAQPCPLNRASQRLPLVRCTEIGGGRYELDFGTNLTGWLNLQLSGLKTGDRVTIHYADKRFTTVGSKQRRRGDRIFGADANAVRYQTFNQFDEFVSAGRPHEQFLSKFNYHGFRYAIVEGLASPPAAGDVQALQIESDLQAGGAFECSDDLLNRIHQLHVWTARCLNLGGYMVDCPTRERLGYGDGQVSIETCVMNFWMPAFYGKWLDDWRLIQNPNTGNLPHIAPWGGGGGGPAWGGSLAAIAWRTYLFYGDRSGLERTYEPMRRYVDYLEKQCTNNILRAHGGFWDFIGDWLAPGYGMDDYRQPPKQAAELFNNCYRVYLWELLQKSAAALDRQDEVQRCQARLEQIRPAIHQAFFDPAAGHYPTGDLKTNAAAQAYQVMPLQMGITPPDQREAVTRKLEELIRTGGHLDTGMLGTYFLVQYLQDGHNDLLYTIASQTNYPGWGYMLSQGATTLWEQWNGFDSQIHSCFLSLGGWFYQGLAGIRPDPAAPGFQKIVIHPALVGDLKWVKAHYDSIHGRIASQWRRQGGKLELDLTIPANTTATVHIPTTDAASVTEAGHPAAEAEGVRSVGTAGGAAIYEVGSGEYRFAATLAAAPVNGKR
jgi:alpha-L-rhamnosidase